MIFSSTASLRTSRPRKRRLRWLLWPLAILVVLLLAGPRVHPRAPAVVLPTVPADPQTLAAWVDARERAVADLRPDNQARVVWADPAHPRRTACAMVYLHGFGASQGEGAPTHRRLAKAFGCNLYLARLPGHGRVADDAMHGLDAQQLADGAALALAIGHVLGDKVIVIGTSTGGSLALDLASAQPAQVDALVLWSPLVRERDGQLAPLLWPWGGMALQYLRNHGSPIIRGNPGSSYWASANHLDGYRTLAELTRGALTPAAFARIHAPLFLGYYYRDDQHQDPTVSVPAMLAMYDELGTPAALKRRQAFPDAGAHVIASPLRSHSVEAVYQASYDFLRQVAGLQPVAPGPG